MMKKWICLLLLVSILTSTVNAAAPAPGDPMGWVLHTDILAYINDTPIRSYNIDGYTYVIAEELADYGFAVTWNAGEADGILRINSGSGSIRAAYTPEPSTHRPGEPAMPYLFTNILTYMAGQPVWGANIGGMTCVCMEDLAYYFAESYIWDPDARELRLTLCENGAAAVPGAWSFTYETPGYDKDTAVSGESAMWEFTKTTDGTFLLTDSVGATLFTPQITFGDDRMSYQVHFEEKLLGLAGSSYFFSASHSIAPHSIIERTLSKQNLFFGIAAQGTVVPGHFRAYVLQNTYKADELLTRAAEATALWRVYINGELVTGLPITMPSSYYNALDGRYATAKEYTYLYNRRIPLDAVHTVRIEIGEGS